MRTTLSSYSLPDTNAVGIFNKGNIENLTYVGTGSFHGVGNALDNVITGGDGMDFLREQLIKYPEHVEPVRELFNTQAANIPRRTDFVFTPNPLGLNRERIQQISYANHSQRMREAGLE